MVTRMHHYSDGMIKEPGGAYVNFSDYAKLQQRIEELEGVVKDAFFEGHQFGLKKGYYWENLKCWNESKAKALLKQEAK